MRKPLYRKFHNLSIQNKMLLSFLLICIICFSTLFLLVIPQLSKSSKENVLYSASQSMEQTQEYISHIMSSLLQNCYAFAYSDNIVETISKPADSCSLGEQLIDMQALDSHISKLKNSHYKTIKNISLYIKEDYSYVSDYDGLFISYSLIKNTEWYKALQKSKYAYYFIPPAWNTSDDYLSVVHLISSPEDYSTFNGALVIDTSVKDIEAILQKCAVTENSYVYLINDEGILVCSTVENPILIHMDTYPNAYSPKLSCSDDNNLYSLYRLDFCGWTLVQVIPNNDLWEISFESIRYFIIAGILLLALCIMFSLRVSSGITKRISMLSRIMRNFRYEKSELIPVDDFGDDIDYLLSSYNRLISDFEILTAENIQKSQKLNETELALLHSQIKPHFLYNTLDMIRSMANHNQIEKATLALRALSGFYKSGLGTKTLWSTLKNEINHIQCYMDIQKLRYGNNIVLCLQIPEEFLDINLPRITLQPIIENALIHGILNKPDKQGCITISATQMGTSDLHITIKDDGLGLSQNELASLFNAKQFGTGIGLWNTNERIRIHYGAAYGLSIRSVPNEFTEITIQIPILRGKEATNDNTNRG